MCGRFTLRTPAQQLAQHFQLPLFADEPLLPRFNIAPSQRVLAIRSDDTGQRCWALLRWGLVPHWAQDAAIGNRMINARSESVAEKPAFRQSFAQRRCLIAADGFYEWAGTGAARHGHFIHRPDHGPFAFAGLWDEWHKADAPWSTCTILTTQANDRLRPLHERMPVILDSKDYAAWLAPASSPAQLLAMLQPADDDALVYYPVGKQVNSPAHDAPDCVTPWERVVGDSETKQEPQPSPKVASRGGRRRKPDAAQGRLPFEE